VYGAGWDRRSSVHGTGWDRRSSVYGTIRPTEVRVRYYWDLRISVYGTGWDRRVQYWLTPTSSVYGTIETDWVPCTVLLRPTEFRVRYYWDLRISVYGTGWDRRSSVYGAGWDRLSSLHGTGWDRRSSVYGTIEAHGGPCTVLMRPTEFRVRYYWDRRISVYGAGWDRRSSVHGTGWDRRSSVYGTIEADGGPCTVLAETKETPLPR
jgi:hypothetical protein